jgi:hypothetical protein
MGLVGVLATQLWHHTFLDGSLADLPTLAGARKVAGAESSTPRWDGSPGCRRLHPGHVPATPER